MAKKIKDIFNSEWNNIQNDVDWVAENLVDVGLDILNLYEKSYGTTESIEDIFIKPSYKFITGNTGNDTKQKCVDIIHENLKDINDLYGTDYNPSQEEIYDFSNVGFLETLYSNIKNPIYCAVSSGLGIYISMFYNMDNLLNLGISDTLNPFDIFNSTLLISGITILGSNIIASSNRSFYSPTFKKISYYNSRKELSNTQITIDVPIHEFSHKLMDEIRSKVKHSNVANEGFATYCPKIMNGKYDSDTDLSILKDKYDLLDCTLNLIDSDLREKKLKQELGFTSESILPPTIKNIKTNYIYLKGYLSTEHLVYTKGESIIAELVAL